MRSGRVPGRSKTPIDFPMVALAEQGARLEPVFIDGQWREIDTPQDLAAAQGMVAAWDR